MGDQVRITACCNTVFFSFFPFLFQGDRIAELPSLCNVVSSFYQLFVPHWAMTVFMCIYLHHRINKPRDTFFEFSSILSIVDLSKTFNHGLNHSKIHTARQLWDFQNLLFLFRQSSMLINVRARIYSTCRTFLRIFYRVRHARSAFYTSVCILYLVRNA